jgi:hypothetical protein
VSYVWQIQHRLFAEQLENLEAEPTPKQLTRLVSATRMLLALHPVDTGGYCRTCIKSRWWWRPRSICTIYAAFLDKNGTLLTGYTARMTAEDLRTLIDSHRSGAKIRTLAERFSPETTTAKRVLREDEARHKDQQRHTA